MNPYSAIPRLVLLGLLTVSALHAAPEDFNATPGYGTSNRASTNPFFEVEVTSATLASETTEPDSRKRLTFHFDVRNVGGGYQEAVVVFLNTASSLPWIVETVTPAAEAGDLAPGSSAIPTTATTTAPLIFLVSAADAEAAKAAILARQHIHVSCRELYRFDGRVDSADAAMDTAFFDATGSGGFVNLHFTAGTPSISALTAGCYLVHNPARFELREPAFAGEEVLRQFLTDVSTADAEYKSSALGTTLLRVLSVTTNADTTVTVNGLEVLAMDAMTSGIASANQMDGFSTPPERDPYAPPIGTSFHTAAEQGKRSAGAPPSSNNTFPHGSRADLQGLFNLHYPFNEVQIAPGVTLDGEFLFRALSVDFDVIERDDVRKKIAVRVTNRIEATLRLTAEAGVDLFEVQKTLLSAPLPTVVIPIFQIPLTIQPILNVKVGASASVGARVQVPIQFATEAGIVMKYDLEQVPGSQISFEPVHQSTPLRASKPCLARAVQANATAWIEAGLDLLVQNTVGPGIAVRATGDLRVRPLQNPWWDVDAKLSLRGRFSVRVLGFNLLGTEAPITQFPSFLLRDAGGPHVPQPLGGPLDNEEGDHVRWGRAVRWNVQTPNAGNACRVHGSTEDVYVAMTTAVPHTTLMRVTGQGDLVWARSIGVSLPHVVCTTDGGVIVGGAAQVSNSIRLIKYDGAGNRVWERNHLLVHGDTAEPQITVVRMLARETGGGAQEIYLVGWRYRNLNSRHVDAFLLRCDGRGNSLGYVSYDSPDYTSVRDAAFTPDGGILFCGMVQRSPDGTSYPGPGIINEGWLMKTDLLGTMLWSKALASRRGNHFNSVTTDPAGNIYTGGFLGTVVDPGYGSAQITKHDADGDLLAGVTLSESPDGSSAIQDYAVKTNHQSGVTQLDTNPTSPNGSGFTSWLPDSGKTVWDEVRRVMWTDNGLIVVSTTGLGANRAATVGCLTEDLSVRWLTAHERAASDENLFDVLPTDDGLFAVGTSGQFLDISTGTTTGNNSAVFLKLPMDGKCDLHPGTQGIHRFLQPGVHDHQNNEGELLLYQPNITGNVAPAGLTTMPGTTSAGSLLSTIQFTTPNVTHWVPLESGDTNVAMTYAQWAAYYHLPATSQSADADADGRSNGEEWFFGGDPLTDQTAPQLDIARDTAGNMQFAFPRSRAAENAMPILQTSTDLLGWSTASFGTLTAEPLTLATDLLRFTLPITAEPRRFYRIAAP